MGPRTSCVYRWCGCLPAVVNGAKDLSCVYRWCGCLQDMVNGAKDFLCL